MVEVNLRTTSNPRGILVQCSNPNCQYRWCYKGRSPFYASCPFCRRNIKLNIKPFENKMNSLQSAEVGGHGQIAVDNEVPSGDGTS